MARPTVDNEKWFQVHDLNQGDKVLLKSGEVAEFVRLKDKNFIGIINGLSYNCFVNNFVKVVEKAEKKDTKSVLNELKKGDYFYINKNGNAILFTYEETSGNKIIGVNPITKGKTRIDTAFEIGRL